MIGSLPITTKSLRDLKRVVKGGKKNMKSNATTIHRAAKLLEEALRLVISLKATKNSNPLKVVVLDKLEAELKELNEVLKEELKKNLLDEAKCWSLLNALFRRVSNYLFNILRCQYFLLRQN